ncbi:unnamed protein product [Aureobasidium pullulans]|nr:unnamed protein product [Aureobasidium pullulans]
MSDPYGYQNQNQGQYGYQPHSKDMEATSKAATSKDLLHLNTATTSMATTNTTSSMVLQPTVDSSTASMASRSTVDLPRLSTKHKRPISPVPSTRSLQPEPPPQDPNNPYAAQQHNQYGPTDPAAGQEGDRGLMGAVAGGLGGGLLGHKAGHGIIGTLAGAFMGSKAEDKLKESRHEKQYEQQYQQGGYGQQGQHHGHHNSHHNQKW